VKPSVVLVAQDTDWTWLLRVPVKEGEQTPMEFFWMWYANTILPMRKAEEQTRDTA
jgi:hypothetical protein